MTSADYAIFMRGLDLIRQPPAPRWYWESDGDRHARTFYVCHTQKLFARVDCESKEEARETAWILNANTQ